MSEQTESHLHRWSIVDGGSSVIDAGESVIEHFGLLDRDWYQARNGVSDETDLLAHFCREGWRQGLQPNPYFDPAWYAKTYHAELSPDENPLLHYIRRGERENAWPSPHFDPEWYRGEYGLGEDASPLQHYLLNRAAGTHSPLPVFDVADYTAGHPECLATGQDPYLHWLQQPKVEVEAPALSESPLATVLALVGGNLEERSLPDTVSRDALTQVLRLFIPHIPFDEAWYCKCYPDVAAAVKCRLIPSAHGHFIDYGFFEGRSPAG